MRPDIDIYGVYVPTLVFIALACFAIHQVLNRILSGIGFYRHVWHKAMFDIALYFSLLGATVLILEGTQR